MVVSLVWAFAVYIYIALAQRKGIVNLFNLTVDIYKYFAIVITSLYLLRFHLARCQELFTENGNVVCSSGNDVGSLCTFECESGFFLTGEQDTNCIELQVGSAWNPIPPKCVGTYWIKSFHSHKRKRNTQIQWAIDNKRLVIMITSDTVSISTDHNAFDCYDAAIPKCVWF